jgi:hypothetical protein
MMLLPAARGLNCVGEETHSSFAPLRDAQAVCDGLWRIGEGWPAQSEAAT